MNRKAIRLLIAKQLLTSKLDVQAIEFSRPIKTALTEIPRCLIYYDNEQADVFAGSQYLPQAYLKTLSINIDVITNASSEAEDFLDEQAEKIEIGMHKDLTLFNTTHGIKQTSTKPYNIESDTGSILYGVSLGFDIPYQAEPFETVRIKMFEKFKIDIYDKNSIFLVGANGDITQ